ncbi:hypothetical protein V1506DRAFT_108452 [Lipomyces tetrasporus]
MSPEVNEGEANENSNKRLTSRSPVYLLSSPSKTKNGNKKRRPLPTRVWTIGDSDKVSQCLNHAETKFEDELYEYGVSYLEMLLSSHFPEAFIPTPPQLSLLFTLISNPKFTTSNIKKRPRLSTIGLDKPDAGTMTSTDTTFEGTAISTTSARLIAKILSSGLSTRDLGFYEIFIIDRSGETLGTHTLRQKRKVKYEGFADSDEDSESESSMKTTQNRGRARPRGSRKHALDDGEDVDGVIRAKGLKMLWPTAEQNLWRIFGWGFRCASAYGMSMSRNADEDGDGDGSRTLEARWPIWKTVIGFLLDILERDWNDAVKIVENSVDQGETDVALKQTLIYSFLRGLELEEYNVRWKAAVASVFSHNSEVDMRQFHPIYPNEVNKKSKSRTVADHGRQIYNNSQIRPYGDAGAVQMRKRALGLIYDALASVTNCIDRQSFFRELSLYIRDLPLQTYLLFLEAPELAKSSMTEYTALLCDSLLQIMTHCPQLPKNWIYSYENGKQYISRYLQLSPIRSHAAEVQRQAEDVVKVSLIVEALLRTWVKVRKTATGTRTRTMTSSGQPAPGTTILAANSGAECTSSSQTNDGVIADTLMEAVDKGISDRRKIFDDARSRYKGDDNHKWHRLDILLKGTQTRMLSMIDNLKDTGRFV